MMRLLEIRSTAGEEAQHSAQSVKVQDDDTSCWSKFQPLDTTVVLNPASAGRSRRRSLIVLTIEPVWGVLVLFLPEMTHYRV